MIKRGHGPSSWEERSVACPRQRSMIFESGTVDHRGKETPLFFARSIELNRSRRSPVFLFFSSIGNWSSGKLVCPAILPDTAKQQTNPIENWTALRLSADFSLGGESTGAAIGRLISNYRETTSIPLATSRYSGRWKCKVCHVENNNRMLHCTYVRTSCSMFELETREHEERSHRERNVLIMFDVVVNHVVGDDD